jgi:HSP20 family protein
MKARRALSIHSSVGGNMANLSVYDPLFGEALDDLFKGFFVRPMRYPAETQVPQIKVDVNETDKTYTVQAEIPGVRKEDVSVTIEGNQVAISAEVKKQKEEKEGEKVLRSERYFGRMYRAFTLGSEIDEAQAQAKYADGVLQLTLPKKPTTQGKQLSIE